jgi:hypothetical protein
MVKIAEACERVVGRDLKKIISSFANGRINVLNLWSWNMINLFKKLKYFPISYFGILTYYKFYISRYGEYWISKNLQMSIWVLFTIFIIISFVTLNKNSKSIYIVNPILCIITIFIFVLKIMLWPIEFNTLFLYSFGVIISIFFIIKFNIENKRMKA